MARLALVREAESAAAGLGHAEPAVLVVDDRRRCVEANSAACRLLGLEREAIVAGRVDRLLATEMRERLEHVWRAFRDGGGHAGPFRLAAPGLVEEVEISLTGNLMPGRHLLVITPAGNEGVPVQSQTQASASGSSGPSVSPNGHTLARQPSAREREILRLLATGATDPQIADLLGLAPATVQTHVRNAKAKLGARTRAQAVAIALDHDLIGI